MRITTIIHERLGRWSRQLRPRLVDRPLRLVETRSPSELEAAALGSACPIVVVATDARLVGLDALPRLRRAAPGALVLLLDAPSTPGLVPLARELGATHVMLAPALPPEVMAWIDRWTPLALSRTQAAGWSVDRREEPEPWEALIAGPPPY